MNFIKILRVVAAIIINYIVISFFCKFTDNTSRLALISFLIIALCTLAHSIANLVNNYKLAIIFQKIMEAVFLLSWFIFLSIVTSEMFIKDYDYEMILFTIPFWLFGIFLTYDRFIKRK